MRSQKNLTPFQMRYRINLKLCGMKCNVTIPPKRCKNAGTDAVSIITVILHGAVSLIFLTIIIIGSVSNFLSGGKKISCRSAITSRGKNTRLWFRFASKTVTAVCTSKKRYSLPPKGKLFRLLFVQELLSTEQRKHNSEKGLEFKSN